MVQTLFGASPTITAPDNAEDTYTMATRVTFGVDGNIVGVRFWGSTNALTTSPFAAIYATTGGAPLYSQAFGSLVTSAWNTLTLSTPQSVSAGTTLDIAVGPRDRYAATLNVFSSPLVVGDLTGTAGRFVANAVLAFPSNTSTTWYAVDVLFEPASGQEVDVDLAVELDIALPVDPVRAVSVGLAVEVDSALAMTVFKSVAVGIAAERDFALSITVDGGGPGSATGSDLSSVYLANVLANSLVNGTPSLSLRDALKVWAANTGNVSVVQVLNVRAGNTLPDWLALQGVLNQLAGTTNLTVQNCLSTLAA